MTVNIGRVELQRIRNLQRRRGKDAGTVVGTTGAARSVDEVRHQLEIELEGLESGPEAEATAKALLAELDRVGDVYVEESGADLEAGYYKLLDASVFTRLPKQRPWRASLQRVVEPIVTRQAEDDNVAGNDTADADAEEGAMVAFTPSQVDVAELVLDPRNLAGAEKLNLPAGRYRVMVRARVQNGVLEGPGDTMYTLSGTGSGSVSHWALGTPYDPSTATTQSPDKAVTISGYNIHGMWWKPDGTRLFVHYSAHSGSDEQLIGVWDVSSNPWIPSAAVRLPAEDFAFTMSAGDDARGLYFKPDGTRFYVYADFDLRTYTLSQAWNPSTATELENVSLGVTWSFGFGFKDDGTKLYLVDRGNDSVRVWDTSGDPWSVTGATEIPGEALSLAAVDVDARPMFWKQDGTRLFVAGNTNKTVHVWDVTSDPWNPSAGVRLPDMDFAAYSTTPNGLYIRETSVEDPATLTARFTQPDGTVIAMSSKATAAETWREYALGDLEVPAGDGGANWYELLVTRATLEEVRVDRVRFVPV